MKYSSYALLPAAVARASGFLHLLSAIVLLAPFASGCSKSDTAGDRPTVLVFSYDEGGELKEKLLDGLIAKFEAENPKLRIQKHPLPGITDLERAFYMSSMAAQSTFVDVFETDVIWTSEFAAGGFLHPVDEYVTDEKRQGWVEPAVTEASYKGKLYAVPYYITYAALFYRPDLMKKHNLSTPVTWEDLVKQAETIAGAEGIHGLVWQARQGEGLVCNFLQFYYNMGGEISVQKRTIVIDGEEQENEIVVFDETALEETLTFMTDLIHKHEISPGAVLDHVGEDSEELFRDGEAAFMINTQAAALYVPEGKIGKGFAMAPLPGRQIALTGGWQMAVNARSVHPDEAFKFAEFMTRETSQREFLTKRGQGPVVKSLYQGEVPGLPQLSVLKQLAVKTRTRPKSPYYHLFSLMLAEEIHAVLEQDNTPKEGTAVILRRCEELDFPKIAEPDFPKEFIYWY